MLAHSAGHISIAYLLGATLFPKRVLSFDFDIDMKKRGRASIVASEADDVVYLGLTRYTGVDSTDPPTLI